MAPKKSNTALAVKPQSVALAAPMEPWELALASEAKNEVAKEATGMARVGHSNNGLEIDGKRVDGNKLRIAVVEYVFSKNYFKEAYVQGKGGTPSCYAYGREEEGMKPHPNAPEPQHEQCAGCPHNAFGTARQGRGKACSDVRKLAVIVPTGDVDGVAQAEVRSLSVPPGSLKNWGKYLRTIPDITPTGNVRAVLTEIGTEPNGGAYSLTFKAVERLDKEFVQSILARRERAAGDLMQPWPTLDTAEKTAPQPKARKSVKGQ